MLRSISSSNNKSKSFARSCMAALGQGAKLITRRQPRSRRNSQTRSVGAICGIELFESRELLSALAAETLTFNGGSSGDPEVRTDNANSRRQLTDHPYFNQDVALPNDRRRVAFWLLDEDPAFPNGGRDVDSQNRLPKLDLPRNVDNRGAGRALQPFVQVNSSTDRIKSFRAEFDPPQSRTVLSSPQSPQT